MADYWTTPKTNWNTSDGIGYGDLNRIEANVSANRWSGFAGIWGFGFAVDNSGGSGYDGVIDVFPGGCYSDDGYPIRLSGTHTKNLNTWAAGDGVTYGGMASAVTVAANTWYYIFVIMDPTTGNTEIMFDDNTAGTNISDATYTKKRYVGAFKTRAAGDQGSFDLCEMYSFDGETVYINPDSMFTGRQITFSNSPGNNNTYQTITLQETSPAEGYALPARPVEAKLNIEAAHDATALDISYGLLSAYASQFSTPGSLIASPPLGVMSGEFVFRIENTAQDSKTTDLDIVVNASRQLKLAIYENAGQTGTVDIAVRGYKDRRLLQ